MATLKARLAQLEARRAPGDDSSADDLQLAAPIVVRLEAQIAADEAAGIIHQKATPEQAAEFQAAMACRAERAP